MDNRFKKEINDKLTEINIYLSRENYKLLNDDIVFLKNQIKEKQQKKKEEAIKIKTWIKFLYYKKNYSIIKLSKLMKVSKVTIFNFWII